MTTSGNTTSLPSIQWIVPFEAAARHQSFKLAAEELNVTPPAISQHVKALENHLELLLFERKTRSLSLTQAGKDFYQLASTIVSTYREGCEHLLRQHQQNAFYVATEPYIANTLLIPNLMAFKNQFMTMELRVEARLTMQGMNYESIDAGIRFGDGQWPGVETLPLQRVTLAPAGNPEYFRRNPASSPKDLKNHCFFYPKSKASPINAFLDALQQKGITLKDSIPCESYLDAMTAAAEGQGITIAMLPYAQRWINEKRLAIPFQMTWPTEERFWLVYRKSHPALDTIKRFHNWLSEITEVHAASI